MSVKKMCSLFILCIFAALLFKKYDMFKIIEQQPHQYFETALSKVLSLWSWATTLPTPALTIGFTDIRIETSMPRLATHRFFPINWDMFPKENTSKTALVQGGTLKYKVRVISRLQRL